MGEYVLLPDLNELARKASDPEVRRLIEEALAEGESPPEPVGQAASSAPPPACRIDVSWEAG
jgi:hypothetical protein